MQKVLNKLKQVPGMVLLACSGGVDSRVLFDLCVRAEMKFFVVHVEHGIRKTGKRDAEFVQKLCEKNNIPFVLVTADVPKLAKDWKMSLEDAGRRVRRMVFAELAHGCSVLLAHQEDDQIETVLMNLMRGAGVMGLTGMREESEIYWRPMLNVSRAEILDYAQKHELAWVEDETNEDLEFTRNAVRKLVREGMDQEGRKELLDFIKQKAKEAEQRQKEVEGWIVGQKGVFAREVLLKLEKEFFGLVVREFWIRLNGSVQGFCAERVHEVCRLLERNVGNKKTSFGKVWVGLREGKICFL